MGRQDESNVFADGQVVEEREMLEHHADAEHPRSIGIAQRDGLALPQDVACARLQQPIEYLDKRRFPRAVLPEQCVDFSGMNVEIDTIVGGETAKTLDDAAQRHKRQRHKRRGRVWR